MSDCTHANVFLIAGSSLIVGAGAMLAALRALRPSCDHRWVGRSAIVDITLNGKPGGEGVITHFRCEKCRAQRGQLASVSGTRPVDANLAVAFTEAGA